MTTRRDGNNIWYSVQEQRVYEILDAARAILENQLAQGQRLLKEQVGAVVGQFSASACRIMKTCSRCPGGGSSG